MTVTWSWNRNEPNAARRLWQHHWAQRRARNSLARMTTRFDIAPEELAQIAMREVASNLGILSLFGPAFGRAFSAPFDRNIAATSTPWYLAGGAPAPIVVYQPKGAASLAASYVNLVNPGTYNAAPGTAPTLDASGWRFVAANSQYLTTGVVFARNNAMLVRFSGLSTLVAQCLIGTGYLGGLAIRLEPVYGGTRYYEYGSYVGIAGDKTSGVMAMAGQQGYFDGLTDGGAIGLGTGVPSSALFIGAASGSGGTPFLPVDGNIQAVAIWNTSTNHATWLPVVMAAAALI